MEKNTPSFFPRDEKILSQKLIIFSTCIHKDILHAWLLALSSAPSALRAIVRCLTPLSARPLRPADGYALAVKDFIHFISF